MGGSHSGDNTDPLQRNGDALVNQNEFAVELAENTGCSEVAFGEKVFHIKSINAIQIIIVNFL